MTHPSGSVSQTRARVSLTRILVTPYIPWADLRLILKRSLHGGAHTGWGTRLPVPATPALPSTHWNTQGCSGSPGAGAWLRAARQKGPREDSGRIPETRSASEVEEAGREELFSRAESRTHMQHTEDPHPGAWGGAHRTGPRASAPCLRPHAPACRLVSGRARGQQETHAHLSAQLRAPWPLSGPG